MISGKVNESTEERATSVYTAAHSGSVVPFSPVLICAINLCNSNFDILASHLPRHLRVHVDTAMRCECFTDYSINK